MAAGEKSRILSGLSDCTAEIKEKNITAFALTIAQFGTIPLQLQSKLRVSYTFNYPLMIIHQHHHCNMEQSRRMHGLL